MPSRIAAALADPESLPDFERLCSRSVAGTRAIAALPLVAAVNEIFSAVANALVLGDIGYERVVAHAQAGESRARPVASTSPDDRSPAAKAYQWASRIMVVSLEMALAVLLGSLTEGNNIAFVAVTAPHTGRLRPVFRPARRPEE